MTIQPDPNRGPWIRTFTGRCFYLFDPQPEEICLVDIAQSLSMICRFVGHCRGFYSVAQHSCHVSDMVGPEHSKWGLLHDAAEAYVGDMNGPLKSMVPEFRSIERRIMYAICERFGLPDEQPHEVSDVDLRMLSTEQRDISHGPSTPAIPYSMRILPWRQEVAKEEFLQVARHLGLS